MPDHPAKRYDDVERRTRPARKDDGGGHNCCLAAVLVAVLPLIGAGVAYAASLGG
jgi:hypothetical protein